MEMAGGSSRGMWRWGHLALLVPALCGAIACDGDVERKVRLTITAQAEIPSQLDHILVQVTAARRDTAGFRICEPATREFWLASAADLPIHIDYFPGREYDAWVAFHVEFSSDDVLLSTEEWMGALSESGVSEWTISLDAACAATLDPCVAGERCVGGVCDPPEGIGPFDDPELIDTGVPCSPAGGGADAGP